MAEKNRDKLREHVRNNARDLAINLVFYDRKEDEDLPKGVIQKMISDGDLGIGEIVGWFRDQLIEELRN